MRKYLLSCVAMMSIIVPATAAEQAARGVEFLRGELGAFQQRCAIRAATGQRHGDSNPNGTEADEALVGGVGIAEPGALDLFERAGESAYAEGVQPGR